MKKIFLALGLASGFGATTAIHADPIDGYLTTSFNYTNQFATGESGGRYGGRLEFGRISRWVAMDFRYSTGLKYSDYGAMLKFTTATISSYNCCMLLSAVS